MLNYRCKRGFTIIEVAVVLTILITILTLTGISLATARKNSRDNERQADINGLVQCLESGYIKNNYYFSTLAELANCPKAEEFMSPPGKNSTGTVMATNANTSPEGVSPQPTKDTYVFQPLTATGQLCSAGGECRGYALHYKLEKETTNKTVREKR